MTSSDSVGRANPRSSAGADGAWVVQWRCSSWTPTPDSRARIAVACSSAPSGSRASTCSPAAVPLTRTSGSCRRVSLAGLAVFAVAAILGATATSAAALTAARCLQGAAAAVSVPSALRLLTTITEDGPQRRAAIAFWSAADAAAGASGFVIGGVVTDLVGWRAVFWAYLPLAVALAVAIGRAVPPDGAADRSVRLNLASSAVFTLAVMAFVVATTLLPTRGAVGILLLVLALVLAGLFAALDRRSGAPLLPGFLLRQRALRQGALGGLLNTLTTGSALTLVTLYLQDTRGRSPPVAGLTLLPFSLAVIAGSAAAAAVLAR